MDTNAPQLDNAIVGGIQSGTDIREDGVLLVVPLHQASNSSFLACPS
jgi:hypothetical protein